MMDALPSAGRSLAGFLNLLKPPGMTSHDVVAFVRRLLGGGKVGHLGTLDPGAAGVLPLALGGATRTLEFLPPARKAYRAEVTFGIETETLDAAGEVLARRDPGPIAPAVLQAACSAWRAALLWHATRDEFLLRDFLLNWLYPRFEAGTQELRTADVETYLGSLAATKAWSPLTRNRVAGALLRSAAQTGLLTGHQTRRFASYHLNDEAFLYLLHALAEREPNGRRLVHSPEWRMFLMGPAEVERELLRLHQYRKLRYEAAGTLAQLQLPDPSLADHVHGRAR